MTDGITDSNLVEDLNEQWASIREGWKRATAEANRKQAELEAELKGAGMGISDIWGSVPEEKPQDQETLDIMLTASTGYVYQNGDIVREKKECDY